MKAITCTIIHCYHQHLAPSRLMGSKTLLMHEDCRVNAHTLGLSTLGPLNDKGHRDPPYAQRLYVAIINTYTNLPPAMMSRLWPLPSLAAEGQGYPLYGSSKFRIVFKTQQYQKWNAITLTCKLPLLFIIHSMQEHQRSHHKTSRIQMQSLRNYRINVLKITFYLKHLVLRLHQTYA